MQTPLRMILAITGCVIVWLGLNVGLGGIQTLGWQGSADFMDVTDEAIYAIRDNHVRFIAGVWSAVGLLMIAGAFWIRQMRGWCLPPAWGRSGCHRLRRRSGIFLATARWIPGTRP